MSSSLLFRVGTIGLSTRGSHTPCTLVNACRHNLRELQVERGFRNHIDSSRTSLNKILHGPGSARDVQQLARALIERHLVPMPKLRRDHVQAIEFLISLPVNTSIDADAYFRASVDWLIGVFGEEMLLSAVVHFDEAAPHMHALVLPVVNGKHVGGAPVKRDRLRLMTEDFAQAVGRPFGLAFTPRVRLTVGQRKDIAAVVLDRLASSSDPVTASALWPCVRAEIARAPQQYLDALGLLPLPVRNPKKLRTVMQIMTSRGKRTSEDREWRNGALPSCVGFCPPLAETQIAGDVQ